MISYRKGDAQWRGPMSEFTRSPQLTTSAPDKHTNTSLTSSTVDKNDVMKYTQYLPASCFSLEPAETRQCRPAQRAASRGTLTAPRRSSAPALARCSGSWPGSPPRSPPAGNGGCTLAPRCIYSPVCSRQIWGF